MEYSLMDFLAWLASGVGSGVAVYWFWGFLERHSTKIDELSKEIKSYLTTILSILVAVAGYVGQLAMNYETMPVETTDWIESVFGVILLALSNVITSKAIHARLQLRNKR